jgi:type VI secretion system protein ImpL
MALLATAGAAGLFLIVAFTVSWSRNRALEDQAVRAALGITAAESTGFNLPSADALRQLETLRQSVETLGTYRRDGVPLSMRWALYTGNELYPRVRRVYFEKFRQLLFAQTQGRLLEFLRSLPGSPAPDYSSTYDTLKAYLITSSNHDKSTRLFLGPVLLDRWSAGRNVDPERLQLARKQYEFYAEELKQENPFSSENDTLAVTKGRGYLAQFGGMERVYAATLADAAKSSPPVNFNRKFPGSSEVVVDNREVAGAFTKGGWEFMKNAIGHPERYFAGEQWVLGDQATGHFDVAKLRQELRERYNADFVKEWRAYMKAAAVVRYASLPDAAKKLNILAGNQSPLLALFALASQNTAVDDPAVSGAFQPVQAVVPAGTVDRFIAPPNQSYMGALLSLQASLEQIANQPGGDTKEEAAGPVLANATSAKVITRQLAQGFRPDPDAHVDAAVEKLMEDPITQVEGLLRVLGPAELNAKGKGLCGQMRPLWSKYPFNPGATAQASVAEVNAAFRRPDGAMWSFYEANLQKLLLRQGSQYVANPGASVHVGPEFLSFFNQAAAISDALYGGNAQDPHFAYTMKGVPAEGMSIGLEIDGQTLSYGGGAPVAKQFVWQGSTAHEAKASVKFGGGPDLVWSNDQGTWAAFHFFDKADRWQAAEAGYNVEWTIRIGKDKDPVTLPNGKPLTMRFDIDTGGMAPVLQRGYMGRAACVAEVAH